MGWFSGRSVEDQLRRVGDDLRRARAELAVTLEQVPHLADDADEWETRAVVGELGAGAQARSARGHADAHRRAAERLGRRIAELERRQDELLDRLGTGGR